MLFRPKPESRRDRLEAALQSARALTPALIFAVVAEACVRVPLPTSKAAALRRLIEAGAFTDAALALVEMELPGWKLRRLCYEDGEWHCCLSNQPNLPVGFDDTAEASHEILPLAILTAFLEAQRRTTGAREVGTRRGRHFGRPWTMRSVATTTPERP